MAETHLKCGEDYLVHGGKVGVPQHLGPLSEGQDPLIPHRSHCGRHLRMTEARRGEKKNFKRNLERLETYIVFDLSCSS